jgi:putative oxidoreductase
VLLGAMFVVFGLNFFLHFIDMSEGMKNLKEPTKQFMGAIAPTGYLATVKVFEILGGALVLVGIAVPIGLTILGPIIVNILLYDIFLEQKANPPVLVITALYLFVFSGYWNHFKSVFQIMAKNRYSHCAVKNP